jgi:hypothetical protein
MTTQDLIKLIFIDYWFLSIPSLVIISLGILIIVLFRTGIIKPKDCSACATVAENTALKELNKELDKKAGDTYTMFLNLIENTKCAVKLAEYNGELLEAVIAKSDRLEQRNEELFNRLLEKSDKQNEVLGELATSVKLLNQASELKLDFILQELRR